jgi:LysR family transcriptional regulator (chromosome initiation inhibitor)
VTPSAVSQRLRALEDRVGAVLVQRGPPARATAAGERLRAHAATVALLEHRLLSGLAAEAPVVRIAVNADSLATWFVPALAGVEGLLFDVEIDDQDHSVQLLRRGEVSAVITSESHPVQGALARPLGALRYAAVASPAFAARWFPDGPTAQALSAAPSLQYDARDRMQADWARDRVGRRVVLPVHRIASTHAFAEAVIHGLGWGMNPEMLVAPALARGELVRLHPAPLDLALTWQVSQIAAEALAPLTRSVLAAARRALVPDAPSAPAISPNR